MTWLDTKVKSSEVIKDSAGNVAKELYTQYDDFFELDDDTTGVDIDGYLFFPNHVNGNGFSHREFIRTKIMSGGEFVSRGQYIPKEFDFETIIDIDPDDLDKYLQIFSLMENKICRVTSPYMGGMFKAEVNIEVTNPESSPDVIECKVTIKEIPDVMARLKGDPVIQYPSVNTVSDVSIKQRETSTKNNENKREELYDSYLGSQSRLSGTG